MTKVSTQVEFYQGAKGPLCRIIRTPEQILAQLLFIPPLFEQANQTRHHTTRSAINAYHQGIKTIVFDHYGTGDSAGELIDANLALWQQDILQQLTDIKASSTLGIYLSLPLSAVLLLSDEILKQVDGVMLLQPDFNGKRFVLQFKRLALAAQLTKNNKVQNDQSIHSQANQQKIIEIAGYQMHADLLEEIVGQSLSKLADFNGCCYWFEWQAASEELSPGRVKQQQALTKKNSGLSIKKVDDGKFWQASELQIADSYLRQEQVIFSQIVFSPVHSSKSEIS
ncbi:hydrolase 2, exosortase A system-associated [Colwellia psychrerythraea]|uniref:Hydrolase, exosortase system type 1 associated protein n=1 Tax=Colwellia psychrerythraea TaxID=28229 RepID=A0A099L581_COLPS|nr:hydrolase 2, exosortase A system-associated [Colwellia psychrerythraea]KGJ97332.1 hydrolase, exosortase system type 1 associated protein [Colwellia psychrerythraea]